MSVPDDLARRQEAAHRAAEHRAIRSAQRLPVTVCSGLCVVMAVALPFVLDDWSPTHVLLAYFGLAVLSCAVALVCQIAFADTAVTIESADLDWITARQIVLLMATQIAGPLIVLMVLEITA